MRCRLHVRLTDVVPVVFGSGKRYFGSVDVQHMLEDPHVVIQGDRVLHLRYRGARLRARRHGRRAVHLNRAKSIDSR